jgi:hypothetical protein
VSNSPKLCVILHWAFSMDTAAVKLLPFLSPPQSPGLLAISLGLSANFYDDHAMLEQGMVIYDALYAWVKSARAEIRNADLFKKS